MPSEEVVVASATSAAPASADELGELTHLFLTSWAEGVKLSTGWYTGVDAAGTQAEKRYGLLGRPQRTIEFTIKTFDRPGNWRLLNAMRGQASHRTLVPLYCDVTKSTSTFYWTWSASSGGAGAVPASSVGIVDFTGVGSIDFVETGGQRGMVVLVKAGDSIARTVTSEPTFDPDPPHARLTQGHVRYDLPADAIVFRDTTGDLRATGNYEIEVKRGGSSMTVTQVSGAGVHVADFPFPSRAWGTVAAADVAGWEDAEEVVRFQMRLIPFDSAHVNASLPEPAPTAIPCDARWRRFFKGGRVAWGVPAYGCAGISPQFEDYEVGVIETVGEDFLALATPATKVWPRYVKVYPLIECDVVLQNACRADDDVHMLATFACKETAGPSALLPIAVPEDLVADGPGFPVFSPPVARNAGQASVGWSRAGSVTPVGLGLVTELSGVRPRAQISVPYRAMKREHYWQYLRLFDGLMGRLYPCFVAAPAALFDVVSTGGASVAVKSVGPISDWDSFPYLCVMTKSAGPKFFSIAGVTRDAGVDTISLSGSPGSTDDVRWVTVGFLARLSADELVEQWYDDERVDVAVDFVELLEEKEAGLPLG
jgi:hypothetical protein